ncbi:MAG TPA: (d)CMP kinase [bacterium]
MARFIVAIDGGAGSGKSTTAKGVAKRLDFFYLDTGAMYRAAALKYIMKKGDPSSMDMEIIKDIIAHTEIDLRRSNGDIRVFLDGRDVSAEIRSLAVSELVSPVSAVPEIRAWMVGKQRAVAEGKNVVCEGRDIGTVVFRDAQVKIFMQADLKVRARRRALEMAGQNIKVELARVYENLAYRDQYDSSRDHSPLKKADDAIVVDTTDLTIEEEISLVEKIVKNKLKLLVNSK